MFIQNLDKITSQDVTNSTTLIQFYTHFVLSKFCKSLGPRSWLRHCATNRKVMALIPDCVLGISLSPKTSESTMAPRANQPLKEMSILIISWVVKAASA